METTTVFRVSGLTVAIVVGIKVRLNITVMAE